MLSYSQNVAGLWLKCGVKSRKIRDFSAPQNSVRDAKNYRHWPLTTSIGRAYNPATERGAALARWPRQVVAPLMLLILMSESTADTSRLSFAVETRVSELP
jgi:hypothetical protein